MRIMKRISDAYLQNYIFIHIAYYVCITYCICILHITYASNAYFLKHVLMHIIKRIYNAYLQKLIIKFVPNAYLGLFRHIMCINEHH